MKVAILGRDGITGKAVANTLSRLSSFEEVCIDDAELIVTSPGIPSEQYPNTNVEIISEIEFAYRLFHRDNSPYTPKIVGITGTNGKTTVTEMISHITGFPTAGNIGAPLIDFVDSPDTPEYLICELSSYQLSACVDFRPDIALMLNLSPDHLKRHKTMNDYANAKAKIWENQTSDDQLIILKDLFAEPKTKAQATLHEIAEASAQSLTGVMPQLMGKHNQINALFAIQAAGLMGIQEEDALAALQTYPAQAHRIEYVASINGVACYNDSKATNPHATASAISSFEKPIHLILGGDDKGLNFDSLIMHIDNSTVVSVIVFGDISDKIKTLWEQKNVDISLNKTDTLEKAVRMILAVAQAGEVILLSPASSSFDLYKNYEARGNHFKEVVLANVQASTSTH